MLSVVAVKREWRVEHLDRDSETDLRNMGVALQDATATSALSNGGCESVSTLSGKPKSGVLRLPLPLRHEDRLRLVAYPVENPEAATRSRKAALLAPAV